MERCKVHKIVASKVAYCRGQAYYHALDWCIAHEVDVPDDGDTMKLAYYNDERGQRLKLKTGKFVRKYWGEGRTDHDVQRIGSAINASLWGAEQVRVLRGEAVREFYRKGPRSCMSGESACYLDVYVDNPEKVGLATVVMDDGCKARALLWTMDNGEVYMDRVYHESDACLQALLDFAGGHGYSRYGHCRLSSVVTVSIRNGENSYWPYMDTFYGVDIVDGGTAVLLEGEGEFEARNTDGSLYGGGARCEECGDRVGDNGQEYGDCTYCEYCFDQLFSYCDHCECTCPADEVQWLEGEQRVVCENCLRQYYTQCEECGEYRDDDDMVTAYKNGGEWSVCQGCMEDNYTQCEECGETYHVDDVRQHPDGNVPYCEECWDSLFWECEKCGDVFMKDEVADVDRQCADCAMEEMCHVKSE